MPLVFPPNPNIDDTVEGPDGLSWIWSGLYWDLIVGEAPVDPPVGGGDIIFTEMTTDTAGSPGTSVSTPAFDYVAGRHYLALSGHIQKVGNPVVSTMVLDPGGANDTEGFSDLYQWSTGSNNRASECHIVQATSSGNGPMTFGFATSPDSWAVTIIEIQNAQDVANPIVANQGHEFVVAADSLSKVTAMPVPGSVDNRFATIFNGNITPSVYSRVGLISDGASVDWTSTPMFNRTGSPLLAAVAGWYDGDPNDDRQPGWIHGTGSTATAGAMTVEIAGGGGVPVPGIDSLLVPDVGAWFGGSFAEDGVQSGSTQQGLDEWEAETGFRPHIIGFYKSGAWSGNPTAAEEALLDPGGIEKHAIPHYRWKPGDGGGNGDWADVAAGLYDSEIDTVAAGIQTYGSPVFFTFFHEPEDNVDGGQNTKADYVAMWQRCRNRFDAAGVTNCIYVMNYMGYAGWAVDANGTGFEDLYPGDAYVDWIAWDPYTHTAGRETWNQLVNATVGGPVGYNGFYNWCVSNHPNKPLMLGEFGSGMTAIKSGMTEQQAADTVEGWVLDLATFTRIKAVEFWNSIEDYDYQVQNRSLLAAEVTLMVNMTFFDNDPDLAL